LDVKVNIGQIIKKDDPIVVLEAMKMENLLKSPIDGVIKSVEIAKGDTVEKSRVLVTFE
jgi:biotin carboxyl carrier protein